MLEILFSCLLWPARSKQLGGMLLLFTCPFWRTNSENATQLSSLTDNNVDVDEMVKCRREVMWWNSASMKKT